MILIRLLNFIIITVLFIALDTLIGGRTTIIIDNILSGIFLSILMFIVYFISLKLANKHNFTLSVFTGTLSCLLIGIIIIIFSNNSNAWMNWTFWRGMVVCFIVSFLIPLMESALKGVIFPQSKK